MREAFEALIERESARRLARLGGTEPDLATPPRRRGDAPRRLDALDLVEVSLVTHPMQPLARVHAVE